MANKLQNVKAVKQMLSGEHRTQTRKSIYTGKSKKEILDADVLEKFENGKPKIWIETDANGYKFRITQHDGFRSREPENSILKSIQNILKVPETCPSCGNNMHKKEKKLNFKFYYSHKKCFGCVLEDERRIKQKGIEAWKSYEKQVMLGNAEGWFKDADKEVEILKTQIKETSWENAEGGRNEVDISSFIEKMETDYLELKSNIKSSFEE
jgi:hypothetical protein|tara:strand:- start:1318 stop:1947 length:630 start_codon:yes stop_codon:yes gene_type:complete